MDNNNQSLACPVCYLDFDTQQCIPKVLPKCGHSICKKCLSQIIKSPRPFCPLDNSNFSQDYRNIDDFSTNYLAISFLEKKEELQRCNIHNKDQDLVCLTNHILVCSGCVIFGEHKGHNVQLLSDFEEIARKKKIHLENISKKISASISSFRKALEEKKETMKKTVKKSFQALHLWIDQQETKKHAEIENLFFEEDLRLCSLSHELSDFKGNIQQKLEDFDGKISDFNVANIAKHDPPSIEKEAEKMLMTMIRKSDRFSDLILALLDNSVFQRRDILKDIKIFEPLKDQIDRLTQERLWGEDEELKDEFSGFLELEKGKQRLILGEVVYPLVKRISGDQFAPKITGMLIDLETLKLNEILEFLKDDKLLKERVDEALELIKMEGFAE